MTNDNYFNRVMNISNLKSSNKISDYVKSYHTEMYCKEIC